MRDGGGACVAGVCMVVGAMRGRRDGHCSGRYAFYWNAFLFWSSLTLNGYDCEIRINNKMESASEVFKLSVP